MPGSLAKVIAAILISSAIRVQAAETCDDIARKAAELRNGADNCDSAVAAGQMSACRVEIPFSLPAALKTAGAEGGLVSPPKARELAGAIGQIPCVRDIDVTVSPPGPLKPGDEFTVTAKVTMADGASPEGIGMSIRPQNEGLLAFGASDGGRGAAVIARKSRKFGAAPIAGALAVVPASGIVTFHGAVSTDAGTRPKPVEIDIDLEGLEKALAGTLGTAAVIVLALTDSEDCSLPPGGDVVDRFIDHSGLRSGFIDEHEKFGGHTHEKHIGKDIGYLKKRMSEEAREALSTFTDLPIAEREIRAAVLDDRARIEKWYLKGRKGELHVSRVGHAGPVGFGITTELPDVAVPKENTLVRIVGYPHCDILILTAYPR